ncbi:hypothetical protein [Saccharibacter floricola]|uniref:Uncharacterized protein n=1 Tax=Saccharibacter floricola DSM 15669 TaxID=1123227 RepID=A0ABQ0NZB2_9PROT|nr:hypothetical protein [Saccharibacter floricola]GBQ07256.1 hypothetical protein AA15669_1300 [Saccharibacter floricola DSM 15669]
MLNTTKKHGSFSAPLGEHKTSIEEQLNELYGIQATLDSLSQGDEPVRAITIAWLAKRLEYVHDEIEKYSLSPMHSSSVQEGIA